MAEHAERFLLGYLSDGVDCHVVDGVQVHYPLGTPLWACGTPFEGIVPLTYEVGRHNPELPIARDRFGQWQAVNDRSCKWENVHLPACVVPYPEDGRIFGPGTKVEILIRGCPEMRGRSIATLPE